MNIPIWIEPCQIGIRVSTGGPLNIVTEAATESLALEQARKNYEEKLASGARWDSLNLSNDRLEKAWMNLASIPEEEWQLFQQAIQDHRSQSESLE